MISLLTPVSGLPGIGPELSKKLSGLGIQTVAEAIWYFPFRHEDWRQRAVIADLVEAEDITILATITSIKSRRAWRRKLMITEAVVTDASQAKLKVVWFNQPYLATWFKPGQALFLSGRLTRKRSGAQMQNPVYERPSVSPLHQKLVPVYASTAGLSQWHIRKLLRQAVMAAQLVPDPLPMDIRQRYGLMPRSEAIEQIHFPDDPARLKRAVRRLKFDELLAWQVAWQQSHDASQEPAAPAIRFQELAVRRFVQRLPFTLTAGQRLAAWQIIQDMTKARAMSRLVQGEVGSGKTVVAVMAAYNAVHQGYQTALIAPTVVLAEQHWQTVTQMLADESMGLALLTGSHIESRPRQVSSRSALLPAIAQGTIQIVVGTHAIFDEALAWQALGLVIIDEQQRFGVSQRQQLIRQQRLAGQPTPHFLSLTATPIPRTLALYLAGELAISTIKEKPPGRPLITSHVYGPDQRAEIDRQIRQTLDQDGQVYVITPLITESDALGVRAATSEHGRLQDALPHARVGLLHGAMPADDRIHVLNQFRQHQLDVLVSTTVIEVGVDIPNATLMVIEGAERFGLAQLHQLRGRVGRGSKASTCLFVTDDPAPAIRQRLRRVADTDDGFALAEADLEQRGSGDVYGLRQSGLPEWRLATLTDTELLSQARTAAQALMTNYPHLLNQPDWQTMRPPVNVISHRE